jgi:hypothetical protein
MSEIAKAPLVIRAPSPAAGRKLTGSDACAIVSAAAQKPIMTPTLRIVKMTCSPPLFLRVLAWTKVRAMTSPAASDFSSQSDASPAAIDVAYAANVMAASAVGPAKPIVADTQPEMNPAAG